MKRYRVRFSPGAMTDIANLHDWLLEVSSIEQAIRYTDELLATCNSLETAPHRGRLRDDIRPELRTLVFRKCIVAYRVRSFDVIVLGIYYCGRDWEVFLKK